MSTIEVIGPRQWLAAAALSASLACGSGPPIGVAEVERAITFSDTPSPFAASRFEDIPIVAKGDICNLFADQTVICQIGLIMLNTNGAGPTVAFPLVLDSAAFIGPARRPDPIACGTACYIEAPSIRASAGGFDLAIGRQVTSFSPSGAVYTPALGHAQLEVDTPSPGSFTLRSNPLDRTRMIFSRPSGCSSVYLTQVTNDFGSISVDYRVGELGCHLAGLSSSAGDRVTVEHDSEHVLVTRSWDFEAIAIEIDTEGRLMRATGPSAANGALGIDVAWLEQRFTALRPSGLPAEELSYTNGGRVTTFSTILGDRSAIDHQVDRVAVGNGTTKRVTTYTVLGGRVAQVVQEDGSSFAYTYTPGGLVATVTPDGNSPLAATYSYNTAGDRTGLTGPYGYSELATYTGWGALASFESTEEPRTTWTYDANGFAVSAQLANGLTTVYGRDTNGMLTSITYPTSPATSESYTYDQYGQIMSETDTYGRTTYLTYDALGRIASFTDVLGRTSTVTRTIGQEGTVTRVSAPYGTAELTTDHYGRVLSRTLTVNGLAAEQATVTHDAAGPTSFRAGRTGSPDAIDLLLTQTGIGAPSSVRLNGTLVQTEAAQVETAGVEDVRLWP